MKKLIIIKTFMSIVAFSVLFSLIILPLSAQNKDHSECEELIYSYIESVNDKNIQEYISLFSSNIRNEMLRHTELYGTDEFFLEKHIELISFKECDCSQGGIKQIKDNEYVIYQVELNIEYTSDIQRTTCSLREGYNQVRFFVINEGGRWYLNCISAIDMENAQNSTRSLACPSQTEIYFTKYQNVAYWGGYSHNIMWNDYIKNVIPKEWYVSRFVYSEYGKIAALASKMYGWYNTVNPKWYFAPYYACMKDNSDDQNYLFSAYNDLPLSVYRTYVDTALSNVSNKAITKSNGNVFMPEYRTNEGTMYSGKLNQTQAYTDVQNGQTYTTVLHYYYDYCSHANNAPVSIVTY